MNDSGQDLGIIYFYYGKAFDSIPMKRTKRLRHNQ